MPMELVVVKTKDNGVKTEDVKRFWKSVQRQRITRPTEDGIRLARLNIFTDDPEGLPEDKGTRIVPFFPDSKVTDPAYHKLSLFENDLFGEGTKTMILDPRLSIRDFSLMEIATGLPDAGTTDETDFTFTDEETTSIAENMTVFMQQAPNWWNNNATSEYHHSYLGFVQGGWSFLKEEFETNSASIQEQYPGEGGFQSWLESFIATNKVMVLPMEVGILSPYAINDSVKNTLYNDEFEEKVRPHIDNTDTPWRGLGGEQESKLFEFDHEYRTVSKQVSFLYLEGEDEPEEDTWLDLWVL